MNSISLRPPAAALTDARISGFGPTDASILLIAPPPNAAELLASNPLNLPHWRGFVKLLHSVGVIFTELRVEYALPRATATDFHEFFEWSGNGRVKRELPIAAEARAHIHARIDAIKPKLVVTLGKLPLYLLFNETALTSWRGSALECTVANVEYPLIPLHSPFELQINYEWNNYTTIDLRRIVRFLKEGAFPKPDYNFTVLDTFELAQHHLLRYIQLLDGSPTPLLVSNDIETIRREISCTGFAISKTDAICLPIRTSREYWTIDQEIELVLLCRRLLTHPNAKIVGQNYLYDIQYKARKWGFVPNVTDDTMFMQHVLFAGMPKDLAFLSSLYCSYHRYWKDDLDDYRKAPKDDNKYFTYNMTDCVRTWEIAHECSSLLDKLNLRHVYTFQMRVFQRVLDTMLRGVRINLSSRLELAKQLFDASAERSHFIESVVGYPLNPKSPKQMAQFLYSELGLPPVKNRKTKEITANAEALETCAHKFPILYPLVDAILEQRSIGVFLSTFVEAKLDPDSRMRCSYNPTGTETYRFNSSENAFGNGTNLQNIPDGSKNKTKFKLPNIRKLFVPDPGFTIFDCDLDRADLQVVVWEADDAQMKWALRSGVDMHLFNARDLFNIDIPDDEIIESHPKCNEHKARHKKPRSFAKQWVHGTNYGGSARTMAITVGITTHESERMQSRWFAAHPGIKRWHQRTEAQLQKSRTITNRFGYRRYYTGRIDNVLPEALAWQPQSTVAIVINKGWDAVATYLETLPPPQRNRIEILLQVHDSLVGQYPTHLEREVLPVLHFNLLVTIPYPDPLIIPVGLKTSTQSWGDCNDRSWPNATQA